jgi:hypothetical protein
LPVNQITRNVQLQLLNTRSNFHKHL